jgi:hypothetical protein
MKKIICNCFHHTRILSGVQDDVDVTEKEEDISGDDDDDDDNDDLPLSERAWKID